MGFGEFLVSNWFNVLSAIGIVGGLAFTAASFASEAKTRRVANLLTLTQNHRELLKVFYSGSDLTRIIDPDAQPHTEPVTLGESAYIIVTILHLSSVYRAMQTDLTMKPEGIRDDIRSIFSLPLPRAVWEKTKAFQDKDFVAFVEGCLK